MASRHSSPLPQGGSKTDRKKRKYREILQRNRLQQQKNLALASDDNSAYAARILQQIASIDKATCDSENSYHAERMSKRVVSRDGETCAS